MPKLAKRADCLNYRTFISRQKAATMLKLYTDRPTNKFLIFILDLCILDLNKSSIFKKIIFIILISSEFTL